MKRSTLILVLVLTALVGQRVHAQCNVVAVADTLEACAGDTLVLSAAGAQDLTWSGDATLSCTNCPSPYVVFNDTSDYVVVEGVSTVSQNANNGNFNNGNTGFFTNYTYNATSIWNEGTYAVGPNPNAVHPNFGSWGDHTTGSGNYMLINGASSGTPILWRQSLNFPPGAVVTMKWWMLTFVTPPGSVQLKLFGVNVGGAASTPATTGTWAQTTRTFTVPASGAVTLNMLTNSSAVAGNDFGMDDISFTYECTSRDTIWLRPRSGAQIALDSTSIFGCDSVCFELTNSLDSAGLLSYEWVLNDGTIDTSTTFVHCISDTGTYSGYLLTSSADGCSDSLVLPSIRVGGTRALLGLTVANSTLSAPMSVDGTWVLDPEEPVEITVNYAAGVRNSDSLYVSSPGGYWSESVGNVVGTMWNWSNVNLKKEEQLICAYLYTPEGCVDSICQSVAFYPTLIVPNFFTPNADNVNDVLDIQSANSDVLHQRIFNRWGTLVFESTDPATSWNGMVNGSEAAAGVYFIEVYAENKYSADREIAHRGTVHLMR